MLRRNPTAITVTGEDISAFEEAHARRLALLRYRRTGEDPNGYFTSSASSSHAQRDDDDHNDNNNNNGNNMQGDVGGGGGMGMDPNDELKPLPGDKARIVRGKEERIVGTSSTSAAGAASAAAAAASMQGRGTR